MCGNHLRNYRDHPISLNEWDYSGRLFELTGISPNREDLLLMKTGPELLIAACLRLENPVVWPLVFPATVAPRMPVGRSGMSGKSPALLLKQRRGTDCKVMDIF